MATVSRPAGYFLVGCALILASCSSDYKRVELNSQESKSYIQELTSFRQRKDVFFRTGPSSPLTTDQKASFQHLNYYPPNLNLIFKVKLLTNRSGKRIGIPATGGETRPAVDFGEFSFRVGGKPVVLHVYKMLADDPGMLFVPFVDETCGKTSYPGGRYIDLQEDSSGVYKLDFNYAYNPYCAYNHNFSCPIVPQENHIDVAIDAGEMKY